MFESAETETAKGEANVKFLIDDLDGNTIEADMIDDMLESFNVDDILYVDGVPCRLSTARSLEAEAVKEARILIREQAAIAPCAGGYPQLNKWLDKWGRN